MSDLLIIEDERDILEMLDELFEGYNTHLASSHCSAIRHLSSTTYRLVICDYQLFKDPCCECRTGLDVFNFMKENNINTPFILYSGASKINLEKFNRGNFLGLIGKTDQDTLVKDSLKVLDSKAA